VPLAVECDFKAPRDLAVVTRQLGPRVTFDQTRIAVRVDRQALDAKMPQQMHGLDVTMLELGRRMLAEIKEGSGHRQIVEQHLRRRMRSGLSLGLEDVAGDMSLSPRALQYRLEQEDTGFEAILSTVRSAETVHYLRDSDLSLSEIAGLLGFSEASAFTRAVRHRFQMTPRDLRRELQAGRLIVPPLN
jgi:AraC-like DNA-binding protein